MGRWLRPRARFRNAAVAVTATCGLLAVPSAAHAAAPVASPPRSVPAVPLPVAPGQSLDELGLDELEARAAKLSQEYRGQLVHLDAAKNAAKKAGRRAKKVNREMEAVRARVAELAASRYMSSGLDPTLSPFMNDDPGAALDQAVIAEHLARSARERVTELQALRTEREEARRRAAVKLKKLRDEIEALEKSRARVEQLIEKFQPESTVIGGSVTPRMAHVRDSIDRRFGPFVSIGCYRPDSFGEHPLGRACDFMLSSGGAMPSGAQAQLGWDTANWATANASRLGIMYIIYRQQIWDIRCGCGWQPMEDRGSVTANHYDHVHVSVF